MRNRQLTLRWMSPWVMIAICITAIILSACGRGRQEETPAEPVETPTAAAVVATATEVPPTPTEEPATSDEGGEVDSSDEADASAEVESANEATEDAADVAAAEVMTETTATDKGETADNADVEATETVTEATATEEGETDEETSDTVAEEGTDAATEVTETSVEDQDDLASVTAAIIKGTCNACHVIPGIAGADIGMVGPDLTNIGNVAATRVEGLDAEEYLWQSISEPNAFLAPECPTGPCLPNLMLANLAELLTEEELQMIIDYLLTLKDG